MALNGLLDIGIAVEDPQSLADFWHRHGLVATADGVLGTADRPVQITLSEGTHRHLTMLHLSCSDPADISAMARRITDAGLTAEVSDGRLECTDPVFGHRVVVEVGEPHALTPGQSRKVNGPGTRSRTDGRANLQIAERGSAPRRVGHVVLGTPRVAEASNFYLNVLGYRISDQVREGMATFARIETDHHNLLIQPSRTSYLNHYALEVDDIDAVGVSGTAVLGERPDCSVIGIGRHRLGSNVFWYLRDPAGNMFEFFADMDQIVDDEEWARVHARYDWDGADGPAGFAEWGPQVPPRDFFAPADLPHIAAAREAAGLGV